LYLITTIPDPPFPLLLAPEVGLEKNAPPLPPPLLAAPFPDGLPPEPPAVPEPQGLAAPKVTP